MFSHAQNMPIFSLKRDHFGVENAYSFNEKKNKTLFKIFNSLILKLFISLVTNEIKIAHFNVYVSISLLVILPIVWTVK